MYVCMYVCMYVRMHAFIYVSVFVCAHVFIYHDSIALKASKPGDKGHVGKHGRVIAILLASSQSSEALVKV